jgi:hypothetical protein
MAKRRYFSWTLGSLKLYWHQNVPSYRKQIIWQTNFSLTSPQKTRKKKKEYLLINKPTKKSALTRLLGFIYLFLPILGFIYFSNKKEKKTFSQKRNNKKLSTRLLLR